MTIKKKERKMKMGKPKKLVIDENQYEQYLIEEVDNLKKENSILKRNLDILQIQYEKIVEVQEAEDCYTCVCGMVAECNCKHMGNLKYKLKDRTYGIL